MTDTDELRQLYAAYEATDRSVDEYRHHGLLCTLAEAVPSLLDELAETQRSLDRYSDKLGNSAAYARQQRERAEARERELEELRSAARTEPPPTHPEHLIWALWTNNDTGRLVLTNREGEVFHFDTTEAHAIAAALADHCTDNDDRWFVRSEWADIDDEDEDDD